MTSSLVGSEMCIRDSPFAGSNATFTPNAGQSMHHSAWSVPAVTKGSMPTCLLYTSDAADDM
eukprot:1088498-Prorocentrum_lima.AAC.1